MTDNSRPPGIKLVDALVDQASVSAHITLSGMRWLEEAWLGGVRMMGQAARGLEDGLRVKIPFREEAAEIAERTTAAVLKVETAVLKASIASGLRAAALLRDRLAEKQSGANAQDPGQSPDGVQDAAANS